MADSQSKSPANKDPAIVRVADAFLDGLRTAWDTAANVMDPGALYENSYILLTLLAHVVVVIAIPIQLSLDVNKPSESQKREFGIVLTLFLIAGVTNLGFRFTNALETNKTLTSIVRYTQLVSLLDVFGLCQALGYTSDGNSKLLIVLIPMGVLASVESLVSLFGLVVAHSHHGFISSAVLFAVSLVATTDSRLTIPSYATITPEFGALTFLFFMSQFAERKLAKTVQENNVEDAKIMEGIGAKVQIALFVCLPFVLFSVSSSLSFWKAVRDVATPLALAMFSSTAVSVFIGTQDVCFSKCLVKLGTTGAAFTIYAAAAYIVFGLTGKDTIGIGTLWALSNVSYLPGQLLFLAGAVFGSATVDETEGAMTKKAISILTLAEENRPLVRLSGGMRRARRVMKGRTIV